MKWAAGMALGLGAGVPWIMCRQTDAPEAIVFPRISIFYLLCTHI